jgi:Cft2 family RNA processing exonuclease
MCCGAGVKVTFIDANHCPGAAQVLFELPDGRRYIHCGDMRYSPKLLDNQHLQRMKHANAVFLDNTYAHPRHAFPLQVTGASLSIHAAPDYFVMSCLQMK